MIDEAQEEHQEDICTYCHKNITNGIRGANGWVCEGSYCDEATESFFDENKYKLRKYKLIKIRENLG